MVRDGYLRSLKRNIPRAPLAWAPAGFPLLELLILTRMPTRTSPHGRIKYWIHPADSGAGSDAPWLVFLHGMLVDHRLFNPQVDHFQGRFNILVWDSPAHNESRPYDLAAIRDGGVLGLGEELLAILDEEGVRDPVLIGQSFGGMVAQAAMRLRPGVARAFIGVDTMPMDHHFWKAWHTRAIRHMEPVLRLRSWEQILTKAPAETSLTPEAQQAVREMLSVYGREEYIQLAATTFRALSDMVNLGLPMRLPRTLLIVGEHDNAGLIRSFNRRWSARDGHELAWIPNAGHNANMDNPAAVNEAIERFLSALPCR